MICPSKSLSMGFIRHNPNRNIRVCFGASQRMIRVLRLIPFFIDSKVRPVYGIVVRALHGTKVRPKRGMKQANRAIMRFSSVIGCKKLRCHQSVEWRGPRMKLPPTRLPLGLTKSCSVGTPTSFFPGGQAPSRRPDNATL